MKRQEQVLFYQFRDMEKLQLARKVLSRMNIVSKVIPVDAWTQKVGYLLGMKGFKAAGKPDADDDFVFPHEVMVLQNIRNKRLDEVLIALRKAGVSKVQYKSVVTPFNTLWTLRRLCETMQKEHAVMVQQQEKEKQKTE
ncbi:MULTISPECIES: DUF3783 domain-containing protein [Selenomonas]|uniref:DUF3783 domain-containing protein n=1 Tax=Selenomonas ruminis TaxID=2593411 RepID=A0A5D6VU11_9FIRM|nr:MULTISPECIES: DUF3783 domain-containing protein [unclassified Selenomonas]MBQ1868481.1 DUF3783 domain-containing protein [Selenomonas sp.]TYZ19723.1 DUF3783 domain-containing protein [Selenomonas sp. mPRGC5]